MPTENPAPYPTTSHFISQDGNRTRTSLYGTRDFKSRASACFATWPWFKSIPQSPSMLVRRTFTGIWTQVTEHRRA